MSRVKDQKCETCNVDMIRIHTWSEAVCEEGCCTSDTVLFQCPTCKTVVVKE